MSLQYVIDAYNIIHHSIFNRSNKDTQDPRQALLRLIQEKRLTGSPKNKVILVFDGYPACASVESQKSDNISIIFSRKISADDKIRQILDESGNLKNTVVVSDDKEVKFFARACGARVLGVAEFAAEKEKPQDKDAFEFKLSYSQMHRINQELKKIWLPDKATS
ncbi:MAG: NYN domain-containing protein [Candidatus Omnitrophica bacterium]|nr:NYN domain-containing protein [Candidatus Omnitrophota bacterium]